MVVDSRWPITRFGVDLNRVIPNSVVDVSGNRLVSQSLGLMRDTGNPLEEDEPFETPFMPTAGGALGATDRVGTAVVVRTGLYDHFPRGNELANGRVGVTYYEGENHGSADFEALLTRQQITTGAVPLTLDGPLGPAPVTIVTPTNLSFYFYGGGDGTNGLQFTVVGSIVVDGVITPTAGIIYDAINLGRVNTTDTWKIVTSITPNKNSLGDVSIGLREVASSILFEYTDDGGRTFEGTFALVNGIETRVDQGYQSALSPMLNSGNIVAFYFKNVIGGAFGNYRRVNSNNGAADAWTEEELVTYTGQHADDAGRPVFYGSIYKTANGNIQGVFATGQFMYLGESSDEGLTWNLSEVAFMADIDSAAPLISGVDQGTKTFRFANAAIYLDQFGAGRLLQVSGSTGNNGIYTTVSSVVAGLDLDVVVSEAIPDPTVDGYVNMTGVVDTNTATSTFTVGGTALASFEVGRRLALNSSQSSINDGLYTIASATQDGNNIEIVVEESILVEPAAVAQGRFQSASLGEAGFVRVDELTYMIMIRLSGSGQLTATQLVTRDGGATRWQCLGQGNSTDPAFASPMLSLVRQAGRAILIWWYHCRVNGGVINMAYQTADLNAALLSSKVWGPVQTVVSTTVEMAVLNSANVTMSATFRRSGYPFPVVSSDGYNALLFFAIETANNRATLYAVPVRPNLEAYFGGWETIESVTLVDDDTYEFEQILDGYKNLRLRGTGIHAQDGRFAIQISEDYGLTAKNSNGDYENYGDVGSSTNFMGLSNIDITAGVKGSVSSEIEVGTVSRPTQSRSFSGAEGSASASGGMVTSYRTVNAVLTKIVFTHTSSGDFNGTIILEGQK